MSIVRSCLPPSGSIIADGYGSPVDYADSYTVSVQHPQGSTVDDFAVMLFRSFPGWVDWLLRLRDVLVKPFGLKTADDIDSFASPPAGNRHEVGDTLELFTVSERNDDEIVMAEDDKQL